MTKIRRRARRAQGTIVLTAGAVLLATAAIPTVAATAAPDRANSTSQSLRAAVTRAGVMDHLHALQAIADAHDGTRASGTPGFEASRHYVVSQLEAAGYTPRVQAFEFPFFRQLGAATLERTAPTAAAYVEGSDFITMTFSGSGDVTAAVQAVDLNLGNLSGSTSGCEASDFTGFAGGNIALVRRGGCTFGIKVTNAQNAGAAAVIVMNTGTEGSTAAFGGTLGGPVGTVPAFGTSFAAGQTLAADGVAAHVAVQTQSDIRTTWNVFAETAGGDPENVVMAGSHLDSVVAGPGLNDNGSGSAAILAVAQKMAKVKPKNKVRFAWWGAEEVGLLGSNHYVADLAANDPESFGDIALYLNFDMVASPNYGLFVYDGDNSAFPVGPSALAGPPGSGAIEQLFHDYYAGQALPSAQTPLSGRSDYRAFIDRGVPTGGVFTGHESVKSAAQAALWGGTAGEVFDPCYHRACDTIANVNVEAIDINSDAIAHAIISLAMSTEVVNGHHKGHPVGAANPTGTPSPEGTDGGGGLHADDDHEVYTE